MYSINHIEVHNSSEILDTECDIWFSTKTVCAYGSVEIELGEIE